MALITLHSTTSVLQELNNNKKHTELFLSHISMEKSF